MGRWAFGLAFVLLAMGFANASYVAHFPQGTAVLRLEKIAAEASLEDNGSSSFAGHLGKYTVSAGNAEGEILVSVSGADESLSALAYEISWLESRGALAAICESTALLAMKNEREPFCAGTGWLSCSIIPSCTPMSGGQLSAGERSFAFPSPIAPARALPSLPPAPQPPAPAAGGAPEIKAAAQNQADSAQGGGQALAGQQLLPLAAALLAAVIIAFLILQQRQEIAPIEPQEVRLLENETRAGIMEQLSEAERIPTDLSARLGKSKATVVEHLETLVRAGFVERVATPGKKFVYYRLTQKGKVALLRSAG